MRHSPRGHRAPLPAQAARPDRGRGLGRPGRATEAADHQDEFLGEEELSGFLDDPDDDYERGSLAIYDEQAMAAFAILSPRTSADPVHLMFLTAAVHPGYRGQGIGGYLLDWDERAARPLHDERFPGRPLSLAGSCQRATRTRSACSAGAATIRRAGSCG
ncbi:MAG: GNAT family N-acetyltransferase [Streptosporangiaceae bacterium]